MHPCVHRNTIYKSQNMEATQMSMDRWMDKDVGVCVCVCMCMCACSVTSVMSNSCNPMDYPARLRCPLPGISRKEYWSGLPCPPPGDLPHQGSNLCFLLWRQILYCWATWEAHMYMCACVDMCVCLLIYIHTHTHTHTHIYTYISVCAHSCPSLCDSRDYSPPGSSVHGIFQARILESITISCSTGFSRPRDQTRISRVSCIGRWILYH